MQKKLNDVDLKPLDSIKVYISEELVTILKISEYLSNPLFPFKIANSIKKAFPSRVNYKDFKYGSSEIICIDINEPIDAKSLDSDAPWEPDKYYCSFGVRLNEFLEGLNMFSDEINKWLKKQGINNLNLLWQDKSFHEHDLFSSSFINLNPPHPNS